MDNRISRAPAPSYSESTAADQEATSGISRAVPEQSAALGQLSGLPAKPYSLSKKAPIVRLSKEQFEDRLYLLADRAEKIASKPHIYSTEIAGKASRLVEIVSRYGEGDDDDATTKYFSYKLGDADAAMLRTHGGYNLTQMFDSIDDPHLETKFGKDRQVTSIVDLVVAHPLATGGGDALLQHVVNHDGDDPLLLSSTSSSVAAGAVDWHHAQGFESMERSLDIHILDPKRQSSKWKTNEAGEKIRADKPEKFLTRIDTSSE
jgi:hypothetical protein